MVLCKQSWAEPGRLPDLGEAAGACVSQPESWHWPAEVTPDWRVGTFPISTWCLSMKWSGSGVHVLKLAFEHTEDILNTDFSCVWYLYRRTHWQSYVFAGAYSGHLHFGATSLNPILTIASIDKFYLNLVICLQLDITLLFQNSVKIWQELWQCIQGFTFSWTQSISISYIFVMGIAILCIVYLNFLSQ